ncbi:MAG: Rrf2 family transcriptional regulator [Acidobacteria bacterium]|nr:Rrf2 family transcriptional regulator [Acidobacteriota bacterium]MBI3655221.1 Rrf2 family transcriptional regulator [Acidobacteriota bacterium]
MYLSKRVDYAIRGICYLATARSSVFVKEISEAERIPQSSLAKIFQSLARHGLVSSMRGRTGGFLLGMRPEQITLIKIVEAIDGPMLPQNCPFVDDACGRKNDCFVYKTWKDAALQMFRAMESVTLQDLLKMEEARHAN